MRFVEKVRNRIASFLRTQNQINLKGKSFVHPSVVISSSVIYGELMAGEGAKIIDGVMIIAESPVTIGRFTTLNGPNSDIITAVNPIVIGSFCSIARSVSIQEYNHRFDRASSYFVSRNILNEGIANDVHSQGSIHIGNDVWVGAQCVILSGAKIGDGAVIGANSTVVGEIPPYAIAVGSPAKVVRYRFSQEVIAGLLDLKWWDWPIDKIKSTRHFFTESLTEELLRETCRNNGIEMEK